jgi:mono/diheme cytochrome c family protein
MMKKIILTVLAVILLEIVAVMIVVYSGIPDVSAAKPEGGLAIWFLNATKDHSIRSRAENIKVPSLNDTSLIAIGFGHYHSMCVTCHGAPGREPDELAAGLNPPARRRPEGLGEPAPDLGISTTDLSPGEMFVIVKGGIKMTGMPAWGQTHSDSALWAIVAFLQRLQTMTPEAYRAYQNSRLQEATEVVDSDQHKEYEH